MLRQANKTRHGFWRSLITAVALVVFIPGYSQAQSYLTDSNSGWRNVNADGATVENKEMVVVSRGINDRAYKHIVHDQSIGDGVIELELMVEDRNQRRAGIVYRWVDSGEFYLLQFNAYERGNTAVELFKPMGWEIFATKPFAIRTGTWYKVRIELRGAEHKIFIDDELILAARDDDILAGHVGLAAAHNGAGRFRMMSVRSSSENYPPKNCYRSAAEDFEVAKWIPLYAPVVSFHLDTIQFFPTDLNFDYDYILTKENQVPNYQAESKHFPHTYARVRQNGSSYRFRYCFYYVNDVKTALGHVVQNPLISEHPHDWEWVDVIVPELGRPPAKVVYYAHGESMTMNFNAVRHEDTMQCKVAVLSEMHGSYPGVPFLVWPGVLGNVERAFIFDLETRRIVRAEYKEVDFRRERITALLCQTDGSTKEVDGVTWHPWWIKIIIGGDVGTGSSVSYMPDSLPGFPYPLQWKQSDF